MARSIEETRKAKREYMARKRAENPEASREYQRNWHRENRAASTAKMRDYYAKRFFWGRAMKLRKRPRASALDLATLWKHQRGKCALTGRRLNRENAHLDHIIPKTRGGTDAKSNLRWVCDEVNMAKRNLTDEEWLLLCRDVMRWIGARIDLFEKTVKNEI